MFVQQIIFLALNVETTFVNVLVDDNGRMSRMGLKSSI